MGSTTVDGSTLVGGGGKPFPRPHPVSRRSGMRRQGRWRYLRAVRWHAASESACQGSASMRGVPAGASSVADQSAVSFTAVRGRCQMDELLVALFDNDARARKAARLLRQCHAEGSVSLYAAAIVVRSPNGSGLVTSEPVSPGRGTAAPAVAAAVGVLVSLLGGAIPAVLRTVRSGLVGTVSELYKVGLDSRFLERISHDLRPSGAAMIAEVEEGDPPLLDAR